MSIISSFFAGLFFANGIPHFVNGISGKDFHNPPLHRFFQNVPSPLFNVIWGLLSFSLAVLLFSLIGEFKFGINFNSFAMAFGFIFASVGLSIYFKNRKKTY